MLSASRHWEKSMIHAVLLCCAILGDGGKPAETTAADRAAYEAARDKSAKNAAAHVQLALWCEAHGMTAERTKHLNLAASLEASNALARGLLGLVDFQGKWAKPEEVKQQIQNDPRLQAIFREYLDRRVHTPQKNTDAQLRLAAWCLENGLKDEAMAHYHAVTRLDPSRDIAWVRLGYKKHKDRWFKPEDLAAHKLEAERQKQADAHWKPRLEKLRAAMEATNDTRRLKAEHELYQITDPRAVPMIWKVFGNGSEKTQLVAVELLSQIDGPSASFCLLSLAIEKPSSEVRGQAARALTYRDPRDVIGWLTNLLHKPYRYQVVSGNGLGSTGALMVDGEKFDLTRLYRFTDVDLNVVPVMSAMFSQRMQAASNAQLRVAVPLDRLLRAQWASMIEEALDESQQRNENIQRTLEDNIRAVDDANAQINETNGRALALLESLTGEKLGDQPAAWQKWWAEQLGFSYTDPSLGSKPSYTDMIGGPDVLVILPMISYYKASCFAAGTLVQTIDGPKRIETLSIGDRVLSQHTSSGALSYQPVLNTTVRGGAGTFRIAIAGEIVVATGIHRFWKAGTGWTMARDLKPGDPLRIVGGTATIQSIEPDATQNVYNLNVAENRNFLIGQSGILVHDVSFVLPVSEPFDRPANAALATSK
jgi:hypothetical protein